MSGDKTIHYVDAILQSLARESDEAKHRFELLRRMPRCMPAECRAVWRNAAFSFIFGQYYGALSVCGAFTECFLEKAIPAFRTSNGQPQESLPEPLYQLINLARDIGLIGTEEAAILQDFRKLVRNRFAHGSVDAIADSLLKVQTGFNASVRDDNVTWKDLHPDEVEAVRQLTAAARLDAAAKTFATPVMRWVGSWAADCARSVWQLEAQR